MSPDTQYVALLRGINVGGKNLIKMTALKACLEADGFRDVATYIQSGNVLFTANPSEAASLSARLAKVLGAAFGYRATVAVRSQKQLAEIIGRAPEGFGGSPARYRYDVIFLIEPLAGGAALKGVPTKEGVDQVSGGKGVLYFSRLIAKATQSHLGRVMSLPMYQHMTIRNWNTTTKLLALMDARA